MTRLLWRMFSTLGRERDVRAERAIAGQQGALRRVAALVAGGAAPGAVFAAVAEEAARVLPEADVTMVGRYDVGHAVEVAGGWSRTGGGLLAGHRSELGGQDVSTLVFRTGRPARVDDPAGGGAVTVAAMGRGARSAAAAPLSAGGRLWGLVIAASAHRNALPPGAEHRLAAFAELAAAAIADAQARAELAACRARILATADETRRRIERDLHDGAQQRLVSLGLRLRAAQETVPPELSGLRAELGRVVAGLEGTLEELREYARGVYPAILTDGGLAPALKALARRSPVPVTLRVHLAGRLPGRVEVTAYYVVSEALANTARHAGASAVRVNADADGDVLRLAVRDDGIGGADPARGSGLAGLRDRVEAIGGTLRMRSRPGEGTTLLAELPTRPGQPATASRPDGEIFILAGPRAPDGGNGGRARTRVPQPVSVRCQIPRMLPGRPGYASVQGVPGPGADSGGLLVIGPRLPAEQASGSPGTGRREPARSAGGRGRPMGEAVIRAQAMAARITRARMSRLHLTALHGSVERACRLAARSRWSCDAGSPSRA